MTTTVIRARSHLRMRCNVPAGAGTAPHERRCLAPLPPAPEEANRELLVPVVVPRAEPHVGRRPLRSPLTMPAPDPLPSRRRRPPLRRRAGVPDLRRESTRAARSASSSNGSRSRGDGRRMHPRHARRPARPPSRRQPDHVRTRRPAGAERTSRRRNRRRGSRDAADTARRAQGAGTDAGIDLVGARDRHARATRHVSSHEPRYSRDGGVLRHARGRRAAR